MVYRKRVKIKGQEYWYLFHTIREGDKYLKKSKYIGKELPKNINEIEKEFEKEVHGQELIIKDKPVSEEDKIIESLHPLERKVIPFVKLKDFSKILDKSKLKDIEVLRALQWLENKDIVRIKKTPKEIVKLDINGQKYLNGLPEKRFLDALDKPKTMKEIMEKAGLDKDEITFCLGFLKKNNLIEISKEIKRLKNKDFKDEQELLKKLPADISKLNEKEKLIVNEFKKRKNIINISLIKEIEANFTELGNKIKDKKFDLNLIENLTSDILAKGSWKNKKFRRY